MRFRPASCVGYTVEMLSGQHLTRQGQPVPTTFPRFTSKTWHSTRPTEFIPPVFYVSFFHLCFLLGPNVHETLVGRTLGSPGTGPDTLSVPVSLDSFVLLWTTSEYRRNVLWGEGSFNSSSDLSTTQTPKGRIQILGSGFPSLDSSRERLLRVRSIKKQR